MTSTFTTNKTLELPANGDYVNTWNIPVNGDMTVIDTALGGTTSLNATAGSATLTYTQYRPLILSVSGAVSANVTYTIPSGVGGQWIVRNAMTDSSGGPWDLIFASGGGGTSVIVSRGYTTTIYSDGTNISYSDSRLSTAAGSNRQIQYNNNGVLGASSTFVYDASGNVGIGTASPAFTLDVIGSGRVGSITTPANPSTGPAAIELGPDRTGDGNSYIDFHSSSATDYECRILRSAGLNGNFNISNLGTGAITLNQIGVGPLIFYTTNTERMRIDASGNVGIGTASPTSGFKLNIADTTAKMQMTSTTGTNLAYSSWNNTGGAVLVGVESSTGGSIFVGTGAYSAVFGHGGGYPVAFATSNTERMRIDASGNVGIGATSPGAKLDVAGTIWSRPGNATGAIAILTADATSGTNGISLSASFATGGYGPIVFNTTGTERMRIDASGNVGIGTSSPLGRFQVVGSAISSPVESIFSTASGDTAYQATLISKYDNDTTTSQVFIRFAVNNNNTTSGQINANGANSAAFGTWSDERLKDNIVNLPSQLANICALRPVEFDYKDGSGHQIGFIAQEMQAIYPDSVGERPDGMLTVTGWSKTEARLVAAIQELAAKVAALEGK